MRTEFDEKAAAWDEDPVRVKRAEVIAGILKSRIDLSTIGSALEYGSGTGLLSFALRDELSAVTLMDESSEMIKLAGKKAAQLQANHFRPVQYNLMKEQMPKERFDLIYILLTLHHVLDYEGLLSKFATLLEPNGYLVIIDLEKEDGSFHDGEFFGHKGFEKCILKSNLEEVDLQFENYEVCYELEKTDEQGDKRKYPLFMMIARKSNSL